MGLLYRSWRGGEDQNGGNGMTARNFIVIVDKYANLLDNCWLVFIYRLLRPQFSMTIWLHYRTLPAIAGLLFLFTACNYIQTEYSFIVWISRYDTHHTHNVMEKRISRTYLGYDKRKCQHRMCNAISDCYIEACLLYFRESQPHEHANMSEEQVGRQVIPLTVS